MLVPTDNPDTKPVVFTLATIGLAETQGFAKAAVPEPVSWVEEPTQTLNVPVIVGNGLTVILAV